MENKFPNGKEKTTNGNKKAPKNPGRHDHREVHTSKENAGSKPEEEKYNQRASENAPSGLPVEGIISRLDHLQELMENRLAYDAGKEQLIRELGDELQGYRNEVSRRQKRPILMDLLHLYDSINNIFQGLQRQENVDRAKIAEVWEMISAELLEVLARQEVYPLEGDISCLDRRLHRAVTTEITTVPEENNMIAKVLRSGFTWGEQVLRPEEVILKKYQAENPGVREGGS